MFRNEPLSREEPAALAHRRPSLPLACWLVGALGAWGCVDPLGPGGTSLPATADAIATMDRQPHRCLVTAAQQQAGLFLERIQSDRLAEFGLRRPAELNRLQVGPPIRLLLFQSSPVAPIRPTATWRVPLVVDSEWRMLLTIEQQGPECRVVALGAAGLARDMMRHRGEWPPTELALLRAIALGGDFLVFDDAVRPLPSGARLLGRSPIADQPTRLSNLVAALSALELAEERIR